MLSSTWPRMAWPASMSAGFVGSVRSVGPACRHRFCGRTITRTLRPTHRAALHLAALPFGDDAGKQIGLAQKVGDEQRAGAQIQFAGTARLLNLAAVHQTD